MKKILVLNGSPKNGNSSTLTVTKAFVDGLIESGEYEVEYVNLSSLNIKPCTGCLSCWGRTAGECVIKNDDIPSFKAKVEEADIFIESYPLFFFGMPGTMKVFTDRMLSMMNTYRGQGAPEDGKSFHGIRNPKPERRFVIISSCAYTEASTIYEPLKMQYDYICGKGEYTFIGVPQLKTLIDLKNEKKITRYLSKFKEAGIEFAKNGKLSKETEDNLLKPPFTESGYKVFLDNFCTEEEEKGKNLK